MKQKLTVLIPCKDERMNIRPAVASARRVADEVLVADSGSTDGTLQIVSELGGCRVIERAYVNSGNFKNWAIPQAAHAWVLVLDADERVTEQLAAEINALLTSARGMTAITFVDPTIFSATAFASAAGARTRCCGCSAAIWPATPAKAITPKP